MNGRVLLAAWVACVGVTLGARAQAPPAPVRVSPVLKEDVAERRMVTGELRPVRITEVASQEDGVVLELLVDVGMRVDAGQVLARLDADRLELARKQTEAQRAAATAAIPEEEAAVDRWNSEVTLLREATERGASNARERRDAEFELRQAKARLDKARLDVEVFDAQIALLQRRLRDMQIVAPFAGTVTAKLTEQGQWLGAGDSVCRLLQTDELEVNLDVPQRYLPVLAAKVDGGELKGADLLVGLDASSSRLAVEHVRVVPQVDDRARTFKLVGRVHPKAGELAAGQSVVGWVPTGTSGQHLVIPTDAVLRNDMGPYVYVSRQMGDGPPQAMPANVTVLFEMPGSVVIEAASLQPGDQVVVEGNDRLYPTAPLAPMAQAASGQATEADRAGSGAEGAG